MEESEDAEAIKGLSEFADDYVTKPFGIRGLGEPIVYLLRPRRPAATTWAEKRDARGEMIAASPHRSQWPQPEKPYVAGDRILDLSPEEERG